MAAAWYTDLQYSVGLHEGQLKSISTEKAAAAAAYTSRGDAFHVGLTIIALHPSLPLSPTERISCEGLQRSNLAKHVQFRIVEDFRSLAAVGCKVSKTSDSFFII